MWSRILALSLTGYMILSKLLNLSEFNFFNPLSKVDSSSISQLGRSNNTIPRMLMQQILIFT